ncbi:exodeoxyribonuclease VII large subunit [Brumimicrobium aurantiacum]|uniref:Exodeoxyribonuclease 7 large subunit n=1 Tax=Brumimicrobium aurantiacum TaxID=1737063 RepID=A0A3E1EWR2_9FLAO|nr:exodeoxyribonuclease VII large subunit [Brumimicrobium aurantiacum]RFC53987.1 exodeoxyribonuclease VII large subunit [Brumimicrobium aurantiacum]
MSEERKIYSLTQLNQSFEKHIWEQFSKRDFWITAELIKINVKSGHHYIELADSVNNNTTARSFATIWASTYRTIVDEIGLKEAQGILQAGNKVLINVKIEFHTIYGLKLKIRAIDPAYSYGEIERKRQEVIKRLKKEELFDLQKQLRLPTIIKRIALIGSPNTSGYRDFQNELLVNHDFNKFVIKEFPVRVQGDMAVNEIVAALQEANLYDVDVIVILRGGGSKMDLALFDDYEISKAICLSKIPVMTGIGHESDEVVSDLVARVTFITPTAVARHIHYAISSFKEIMRELHDKTIQISQQLLAEHREEFLHYNNYLSHYSRELIHYWRSSFQENEYEILQKSRTLLYKAKDDMASLSHRTSSQLQRMVQQEGSQLDRTFERIVDLTQQKLERESAVNLNQVLNSVELFSQQIIERERLIFRNQEELLGLLNPLKILSSGYTISTIDNEDVKDRDIEVGDEMSTLASNYLIKSKVISKKEIQEHKE